MKHSLSPIILTILLTYGASNDYQRYLNNMLKFIIFTHLKKWLPNNRLQLQHSVVGGNYLRHLNYLYRRNRQSAACPG